MSKQNKPEQKKRVQKTAVSKRAKQELKGSPTSQQSGLNNAIDGAEQLSSADLQDMQQTYGNHFLQRLVGVSLDESDEEEDTAMRAADDGAGMSVSDGVEGRIDQARGGGQALPGGFKQQMEGQFGADFDNVRVHTDGESDALNHSLQAKAFTTGSDIFFREGEYDTSSKEGQKLVAHELTHVVQQGGTQRKPVQPQMTVNPPDDKYEKEADAAAEQAVQGGQAETAVPPTGGDVEANGASSAAGGEGETATPTTPEPAEQKDVSAAPVSDEGAVEELMSIKDHPAVKEATDEAKKEAKGQEAEVQEGTEAATAAEADADKPKDPDSNDQQDQDPVAAAKEDAQETADSAEGEEAKKEKKEKKEDEQKKPAELTKEGVPKIKKEDTGRVEDMKYDSDKLEEPEQPEALPSWDELAYGTVQTYAVDEVAAESRQRDLLIMGPTVLESTDEPAADEGKADDAEGGEADEETGDGAEIDKYELIKDAFVGGVAEGMIEGGTEFATDQAMQSFLERGPGKKVPYADGAMNIAQIAMDPEGWAGGVKDAFGEKGFSQMSEGWGNIGKEKTWAGQIAGFLEATIGTIDWINGMLGIVQQILQTVLFILAGIAAALSATGVGASVVPVLLKIIAFLEKINNLVIKVNDFLQYGVKPPLEVLAILFRTIDIAIFDGDPEELIEKQQKLKGTVSSFAKSTTQRTLDSKFKDKQGKQSDKDDAKLEDAKSKRREEIEKKPVDIPDPKTGKKREDLINDYEAKYGTSYDVDTRRQNKELSDDPVDMARDRKLDADAQVKKAQKDLEVAQKAADKRKYAKKGQESIETIEAQQNLDAAKKNQEEAEEDIFNAQTGKIVDEGGLFGMDKPEAPTKSKWERFKDKTSKFDDLVLRGQGKDMVDEYKNVKTKEDWFTTNTSEWSGQRHGAGVTGQFNNLNAMLLERITGGKITSVNDLSKGLLEEIGFDLHKTKDPESYGASVIEFKLSWSSNVDGWEWGEDADEIADSDNPLGTIADAKPANDETKNRWKDESWKDAKGIKAPAAPEDSREWIVQPGRYMVSKRKGKFLTLVKSDGPSEADMDGKPAFSEKTVSVDAGSREEVELSFEANPILEGQAKRDESVPLQREETEEQQVAGAAESAEIGGEETAVPEIPPEVIMDALMGSLGDMSESDEAAMEGDDEDAEVVIPPDLQLYQQERTLDIIEELPEPPESAREITAAAETYNLLAAQEDIANMRQQDIDLRKEDAQSQIIEMEKVQEVTAVNQTALVGYQQDVNQKLAAQDKEKEASQQASNEASQAQSDASSAQGIMGMVMAPLTKLLTTVVKEFTDMDTSGGTGSAAKANSSMKEPTKGADTGAAGGEAGIAEAQERTMQTLRAQSDATQTQKDLKVLDETMQTQTLSAEEGIEELDEAQDENTEQLTEMQDGKDEALMQYEDGMDEAESWAEEHRGMREMMFEQLQEELETKAEE